MYKSRKMRSIPDSGARQNGYSRIQRLLLVLSLVSVWSLRSAVAQQGFEVAAYRLFGKHNDSDGPRLAVAVVRNGTVLSSKGYGLADTEHGVAVSGSTVFDIASVQRPLRT
jgi:CubicO group peptidase (beta-lactamase class C family)